MMRHALLDLDRFAAAMPRLPSTAMRSNGASAVRDSLPWGGDSAMPKPYSLDLRERVVGLVGGSRRAAAHFKVFGFVRCEPDEGRSHGGGKLRTQTQRRATPRQARTASVVSFGAGGREGRHHQPQLAAALAAATG
jgi:hypothetical protein